jgi:hypothetical protein
MKGPHERLKYDLRRLWECPVCKRRERTPGSVTFRHCSCQLKQIDGKPVVMKLIEDAVQRIAPPTTIQHEPLAATMIAEPPSSSSEATPTDTAISSAPAGPRDDG